MIKPPADYEHVASRIIEAGSVTDALEVLSTAYGIEFVTYHLASTIVADMDAPFVRTTYPDHWVSAYLLKGYVRIDPVVQEGFKRQLPFHWLELEIAPEAFGFVEDANSHGISPLGFSIPVRDKAGRRAILSFNVKACAGQWDIFVETCRTDWVELAYLVHQKAVSEIFGETDPIPSVSTRERECLYWSALGKDYKDIAIILGLSHHTTRSYIKSARVKLGCATISAAAALALKLRLISI